MGKRVLTMKHIRRCVATLVVAALFLSLIPPCVSNADVSVKVTTSNYRIYGATRYDTSFEIADNLAKRFGTFDSIIVANGETYPDALSGSYLAYEKDAPVLLINSEREIEVFNYIRTHLRANGTVYMLGGEYAVSKGFEERLTNSGIKSERYAGINRYGTNYEILNANMPRGGEVLICSGKGFADNLSASATGLPILLVDTYFTIDQIKLLESMRPSKIYIIGGTSAVGIPVAVRAGMIATTVRIGGENRFDTSKLVADEFFPSNQETIFLTNGMNFPDGLSGAPLAMYFESPILLVNDRGYEKANEYVRSKGALKSYTLGGELAISQDTVEKIMEWYRNIDPSKPRQDVGTVDDILNVMRGWLGYDEISGKHKAIIDLYNSYLPLPVGYKVLYTDEWCDTCVTAAAIKAGCVDFIGRECGVGRHLDIFRRKGIWIEDGTITPEPGYIIIYNWGKSTQPNNWGASHIGIVEYATVTGMDEHGNATGTICVLEGNYTPNGGTNGTVGRRYIPIGYGSIRGFASPNYAEEQIDE